MFRIRLEQRKTTPRNFYVPQELDKAMDGTSNRTNILPVLLFSLLLIISGCTESKPPWDVGVTAHTDETDGSISLTVELVWSGYLSQGARLENTTVIFVDSDNNTLRRRNLGTVPRQETPDWPSMRFNETFQKRPYSIILQPTDINNPHGKRYTLTGLVWDDDRGAYTSVNLISVGSSGSGLFSGESYRCHVPRACAKLTRSEAVR